ncbi:hypothetical protein C2G38_2160629 [Gigaspora rosea]|uniref:Uncharacterized protein n=1 Tax=Gigaspora rosea TaxID=44941 RepID=A0A397VZL7_9GLOM|nr:hypothetical protein C2G38_2160629 [Gigaspora rosea]
MGTPQQKEAMGKITLILGGKDLNITIGIPCKIINDGHYLDNGEEVMVHMLDYLNSYNQNDSNYARQIWFLEESKNYGEYIISSDRNYLDTFGDRDGLFNSSDEDVQIQNLSNECYLDNWGGYSTVHFSKYLNEPSYSRQLWKFEIADYKLKAEIENFKYDKKINDLDSYIKKVSIVIFTSRNQSCTEYAGVKGTFHKIIKWNNKTTSLETTNKLKLNKTNISGKY